MWGRLTIIAVQAGAFCLAAGRPAQGSTLRGALYQSEQQVSAADILVATEKLGDANFAQSVILIIQYNDQGTVGLIINRRTEIPLSKVFPKTKGATADPVYMGGPVGITAAEALLRLPKKADQAANIMADVYVTGAKGLIEKSVASRLDPARFRLYLGYAGWAPGQLEAEIQIGAWSVLSGRPNIVFDRDPDSLWSRLTRDLHMQIAWAGPEILGPDNSISAHAQRVPGADNCFPNANIINAGRPPRNR